MAKDLSKSNFEEEVINSDKKVLVDFFAPWCGPCQMMGPVIDDLHEELKDKAGVFKVNVDEEPELANQFQVMSIPTILIFDKGKVVNQFMGVTSKEDLKKSLE